MVLIAKPVEKDYAPPTRGAAQISGKSSKAVKQMHSRLFERLRGGTYCFANCGAQGQRCASWG